MNDICCRQLISLGDHCFPSWQVFPTQQFFPNLFAFLKQFLPDLPVNRAIDTTAPHQGTICSIDNDICLLFRNLSCHHFHHISIDFYLHPTTSLLHCLTFIPYLKIDSPLLVKVPPLN